MNFNKACKLLNIEPPFTRKMLTQNYYKEALKWHPDKNIDDEVNASSRFKEIGSAYQTLILYLEKDKDKDSKFEFKLESNHGIYSSLLQHFLNCISDNPTIQLAAQMVYQQTKKGCTDIAIKKLKTLDKKTRVMLLQYLDTYKDILDIDSSLLDVLRETPQESMDQHYILNPTLTNLLQKEVFCLKIDEDFFHVPLWHEEVVFDVSDTKLIVTSKLDLPNHITIDHNNDIHIDVSACIKKTLLDGYINIELGGKVFELPSHKLLIQERQITRLKSQGAPRINPDDILDVSVIGDIVVHLNFK